MRTARGILSRQHRREVPPHWVGGFYRPPRSTPTSTRVEALCSAYAMARDAGRAGDAAAILEGIRMSVRFIQSMQYLQAESRYLPDPARAIGGIRGGTRSGEIRNDYVQHFISAVLGARRIQLTAEIGPQSRLAPRTSPRPK